MFTGALAASYYGTPRTTTDVDMVVSVPSDIFKNMLVSALRRAGLQVDEERIDSALKSGFRIVTLMDSRSPFTVDIIISNKSLEKKSGTILGLPTFYQTPEELVLAKLCMIKATIPRERALKDEDDVRAILRFTEVSMNILRKRAQENSTLPILETIVAETTS